MMEQVKKTARQITASSTTTTTTTEANEEENEDKSSDSESEDDDLIGPPVPKPEHLESTKGNKVKDDENDSDSENESDNDVEQDLTKKIPASHEVCMQHGLKAVTAISADPSGARLGKKLL